MALSDKERDEQVELSERLQLKWLKRMDTMLDAGDISATDMATLMRFLVANGWNLDPARIPKNLRDKLTSRLDPKSLDEVDGVVGRISA